MLKLMNGELYLTRIRNGAWLGDIVDIISLASLCLCREYRDVKRAALTLVVSDLNNV